MEDNKELIDALYAFGDYQRRFSVSVEEFRSGTTKLEKLESELAGNLYRFCGDLNDIVTDHKRSLKNFIESQQFPTERDVLNAINSYTHDFNEIYLSFKNGYLTQAEATDMLNDNCTSLINYINATNVVCFFKYEDGTFDFLARDKKYKIIEQNLFGAAMKYQKYSKSIDLNAKTFFDSHKVRRMKKPTESNND